jgi:subtilisin family serine protease
MRIGGRIGSGVLVLGLVFAAAPAANAESAANAAPPRAAAAAAHTVTLITGDRVTTRDGTTVSVRPGPGRENVTFSRFNADGHLFVLPHDARQLVASGRLDQRLFDLTTLREFGYDDAHSDTVPLIVTHPQGRSAPRAARVARELPSIDGVAMAVDKGSAGAAWEALTDGATTRTMAEGVTAVWLDGKRRSTLDQSAAQIGAPAAWDAGITGSGVTVAVLDTGVDQTHPDLADREVAERNFTEAPDNVDNVGHGTHVASIAAGTGAKSGGRYRGIAHGASIMDGKVLDDGGFGLDSWIIAGMEWAAEQGADIANLSLGGFDTTAVDPVEQAVESLTEQYGTLFVIAAGNSGPGEHSVGSPGSAPSALTVGAVNRDDTLADFSSRGPTEEPGVLKPDITAPGVGIVAALHSAGTIGEPVADGYTALTGTSMAAPHVAGAAALVAQRHPDWSGQQIKAALTGSAVPAPGVGVFEQGAGRVDAAHAITQTVVTEPASVHVGIAAWPHEDDEPLRRTVTYRNLGEADATLALAVTGTGSDGAPAEVFSLSADELTVPAGGEASVTVTGDTRAVADGHYSGTITATGDGSVTRTPVLVTREVESYDLTFDYRDENGAPTGEYSTFLLGIDSGRLILPYDEDGSETVRLPKGRYFADHVVVPGEGERVHAILHPGIMLDRDLSLEVDAASTRPIDVTPPVSATLGLADVGYLLQVDGEPFAGGGFGSDDPDGLYTAQVGEPLPGTTVSGWVSTHWSGEDGAYYGLAWALEEFPTGFERVVDRSELARLRVELGAGPEGGSATRSKTPLPAPGLVSGFEYGYDVTVPGTLTEYVTTEDVTWRSSLWQFTAAEDLVLLLDSPWLSYRPGRTYRAPMNKPVFGPGLPEAGLPWVYRSGDAIDVYLPLFTDGHDNASTLFAASGSTKLYRGAELVGESSSPGTGYFPDLPADSARYRLTTEATRAHFDLSTTVSAEWTFTSSSVDDPEPVAVDLNVVRFTPRVDPDGSAPAGRPFRLPVRVQDETGASVRPSRIVVEASYDEGRTWRRVPVGHDLIATLHHPADATSVSLRASAADRDGNTVRQTVLRAYTLR